MPTALPIFLGLSNTYDSIFQGRLINAISPCSQSLASFFDLTCFVSHRPPPSRAYSSSTIFSNNNSVGPHCIPHHFTKTNVRFCYLNLEPVFFIRLLVQGVRCALRDASVSVVVEGSFRLVVVGGAPVGIFLVSSIEAGVMLHECLDGGEERIVAACFQDNYVIRFSFVHPKV